MEEGLSGKVRSCRCRCGREKGGVERGSMDDGLVHVGAHGSG